MIAIGKGGQLVAPTRRDQVPEPLRMFTIPLEVAPFDDASAEHYGRVRSTLEASGTPIGPLDTLIAAHGLALNAVVVTNNTREFTKVAGLHVEDWSVG